MLAHPNKQQLQDYLSQQLDVAELLTVSEHLEGCETCRQQLQVGMSGDLPFLSLHEGLAKELGDPAGHLTAAQTADYVDKNLAGEEKDSRLTTYQLVRFASSQLQIFEPFEIEIATSIDNDYQPVIIHEQPARSRWQFSRIFPVLTSPAPAFFAALMVILFGTATWLVWRATRPAAYVATSPTPLPQPSTNSESPAPVATPSQAEVIPVVAQLNDGNGEFGPPARKENSPVLRIFPLTTRAY